MPLATVCRLCHGRGFFWNRDGSLYACADCKGSGHVDRYRVPLSSYKANEHGWDKILTWPRYGRKGRCAVCNKKLTGRQTVFCADHSSGMLIHHRLYESVHWQKRHVCLRDGCVCRGCGEKFESPLVPGGPIYPEPRRLELDHIVPIHKGGGENPENLQLLCKSCHLEKTKRDLRVEPDPSQVDLEFGGEQ